MRELTRYLSTTVRVFPDYAGTIIWFTIGPFDYDSARIPQDLRVAMQEWEETYYAGLDSPDAAPELVGAYDLEGLHLAEQLSQLVGQEFAVEYPSGSEVGRSCCIQGRRAGGLAGCCCGVPCSS